MGRIRWHGAEPKPTRASRLSVHIGGQLLKLRAKQQITMRDAAQRCGLSVAFFCDMENGKSGPSADTLWQMSCEMGVPIGYWFIGFVEES